jgi:cyclophilin family peptidyl-prolyl cis-trans isomerase
MRPFLIILGLVLGCIALAAITSHLKTNTADIPMADRPDPNETEKAKMTAGITDPKDLLSYDKVTQGAIHATLEIEGRGVMTLELYPQAAPQTVKHLQDLCAQHFYDGLLFHRVVPGFVAQAGDPNSKPIESAKIAGLTEDQITQQYHLGGGGSGKTVPLEAKLPHKQFSLGLARSEATSSGDSQFFINLKDNTSLDGKYCAFGRIVQGAEIANQIKPGDRIKRLSIP